jgi:hypothetical protein
LSVDELRQRGNVIAAADAWMELLCVPAADATFDPSIPITLSTKILMSSATGVTYTFVTRRLEPLSVSADDSGHFRLVLTYEPLNANEVIGRPIDTFAAITTVTTRYNDVLHAVGLQIAEDGVRSFALNINGLEAVKVQGFHADMNPPGDATWNVAPSFSNVAATYAQALQTRIAARAESEPSPPPAHQTAADQTATQ